MDDTGDPQGDKLAETTRRQNSNMKRLIDAVGTLLAASRELLRSLQPLGDAKPPNDSAGEQNEAGPPDAHLPDKPPPTDPEKS